jgi:hypothetical protein
MYFVLPQKQLAFAFKTIYAAPVAIHFKTACAAMQFFIYPVLISFLKQSYFQQC